MKELSKTACELVKVLKKRCNQDSCIGIVLELGGASLPSTLREQHDADSCYRQMIDWIKLNPKADQSAIIDRQDVIMEMIPFFDMKSIATKKPPQKKLAQKVARKIAVF